MENTPVPEILREHGQFVRTLAGALLRDPHAAEDLAQETWVRFLVARPADEGGLRNWFRVVARNLVLQRVRSERGRAAREEDAARPESLVPSADEALEHEELLGVLVQAVLALDEPYRSTIVDRYYRGLDSAAIAARSGTTAATVRSREHRALEKLRAALAHQRRDRRDAWATVLARFLASEGAPSAPAGGALGAVLAVSLAAAAAVTFLWLRAPATPTLDDPPLSAAAAPGETHATGTGAVAIPSSEAPAEARTAREPSAPAPGSVVALDSTSCEIRGRLTFPGGQPAAGVALAVHGWGRGQDALLRYGEPDDWVDPGSESDAGGSFSLRFVPPPAFQFTLEARAPGHARASWRWSEIAPGATLDVGEVELPVGGTIEGRMVDAQGVPLVGEEWAVFGTTVGLARSGGRRETQVDAAVDPETGTFRLTDVWPTQVELRANSPMANWIRGPLVAVRSGETSTADLVYAGPGNARRITVVTDCSAFPVMNSPAVEHVRLTGPAGETRTATKIPGSTQSFSFEDLPPGSYVLDIDDPRYLPWSQAGLAPGQSVEASLHGNAALRLSVLDAAGQPVALYAVRITFRNQGLSPTEYEVHDGTSALPDGLVAGLFPGDYTVTARLPDGTSVRCEVDALQRDETRAVRLELGGRLFVSGHVRHGPEDAVAGAEVLLLKPAEPDDSDASPILPEGVRGSLPGYRLQLAHTIADADGAFRFDLAQPGTFLLCARSGGSRVFSAPLVLETARADQELVLPLPGAVRGRVLLPPGANLEGIGLWIAPASVWGPRVLGPAGMGRVYVARDSLDHAVATLEADGTFELDNLPPGPSRAFLVIRELTERSVTLTEDGIAGGLELGALDVPAGGVLEWSSEALELPATLSLVLLVDGSPAPFVDLTLRAGEERSRIQLKCRTDAEGRAGPVRALSGNWRVYAQDREAGWGAWVAAPLLVAPSEEASVTLTLETGRGALLCVDAAGAPLAGADVYVLHAGGGSAGGGSYPLAVRTTDASGRIELELVPGEYTLHRSDGHSRPGTVPGTAFTWTTDGPLDERVIL